MSHYWELHQKVYSTHTSYSRTVVKTEKQVVSQQLSQLDDWSAD